MAADNLTRSQSLKQAAANIPAAFRLVWDAHHGATIIMALLTLGCALIPAAQAWVKAIGFDPKKGTKTTASKYWEVDANGVKWALTSNKERFDTFEFGSQGGITSDGGEDNTFAESMSAADAAFGA